MDANKVFSGKIEFVAGAQTHEQIPVIGLPEIAFAGRSNVGKSSLINAVCIRKALARVSHTPGRTRQINFFNIADKVVLVDLPGYGYAKTSKMMRASWGELIVDYLRGRAELWRVYLLIDSRHGLKDTDLQIMEILDKVGQSYQIVMTKEDKTSKADIEKIKKSIEDSMPKHPALHPIVLTTSAEDKTGIEALQQEIVSFVRK